eukprot:scaffold5113_cov156-Skeletonema_menzelii.AAC.2
MPPVSSDPSMPVMLSSSKASVRDHKSITMKVVVYKPQVQNSESGAVLATKLSLTERRYERNEEYNSNREKNRRRSSANESIVGS